MTTLYKLTDTNGNTQNDTHWEAGVTHSIEPCKNPTLCSGDVFHSYKNINLAFLLNLIHANLKNPLLWEVKGKIVVEDYGKVGCFELEVIRQLKVPEWVYSDKIRDIQTLFAILCAEQVIDIFESQYPKDDRPRKAIDAAKEYLKLHTEDAAHAAAYAAHAAADAAYAAHAAHAAYAAHAAAHAAYAAADAAHAAHAAAYAAHAAADAADNIDFSKLADLAVKTVMEQE